MAKELINETKIENLFSVKDKVILIIGAGGLGGFLAKGFMDNGAYVVITNRTIDKADAVKADLAKQGLTKIDTYAMEITKKESIQACCR